MTINIHSVQEMHALANEISKLVPAGALIGLSGELGAGKTEFVKGLGSALGVEDEIVSPSYGIQIVYPVKGNEQINELWHFDCYRLSPGANIDEFREASNLLKGLTVVEWPEKVPEIEHLLSHYLKIKSLDSEDSREVSLVKGFKEKDLSALSINLTENYG